ncbi:sensor histidine kinase [Pedobacter helvus]|uniref:histidine kinase n=1 Tax=Pedobacter helvus TaxID=2563444 RepID=A0ABW9JHM3_9SPHI|nr:ATP-binding protein [Pedobacter ureilyticus]
MKLFKNIFGSLFFFFFLINAVNAQIKQIGKELEIAAATKERTQLVDVFNRIGSLYTTRNADSCFYYGLKSKKLAVNIGYKKGQADADLIIAFSFFKMGIYAESLELLSKTLPYYEQNNDTENIIKIYLNMVEVLNKGISERPKIISLMQKAIRLGKNLKKDSIMSQVYLSYCNRNPSLSTDSVHYYLSKSREIAHRYKDEHMMMFNRIWEARLLILDGKLSKAFPLVKQLITEAQHIGNRDIEINARFLMVGYAETNPKMALEHCYKAYEAANASGYSYIEIYILNNALAIAKNINNKDEIIKVYAQLDKAMSGDWEKSRKFMGDYVKYNAIQTDNLLLSKKTTQITLWLIIISAVSVVIVLSIYLIMLRQKKKVSEQLAALDEATRLQVMAMEEAKYQAVREEQQRLGQDLHDGLSSSIAAIKHQLEVLIMDADSNELKSKLTKLQIETERAYMVARNKSHEWFIQADGQQEQSFEKQIKLLTEISLPDNRYTKTILIDDNSLAGVDMDTRISLLRIIQGAVTNIIKHAKAKCVNILVYEEENTLLLHISDDGIGLGRDVSGGLKSNIGLQSIFRRAELLNGRAQINSNDKGTEVIVSIPLAFNS